MYRCENKAHAEKVKQQQYYNRHTVQLEELRSSDTVRFRAPRSEKWIKATVDTQIDVRSYRIRTETGKMYRRNRKQLRKSTEIVHMQPQNIQVPVRGQTGSDGENENKMSNARETLANKQVVEKKQERVSVQNSQAPIVQSRPNQAKLTGQENVSGTPQKTGTGTGAGQRNAVVTPGRSTTADTLQKSAQNSTADNCKRTSSGRVVRKPSYLQDYVEK